MSEPTDDRTGQAFRRAFEDRADGLDLQQLKVPTVRPRRTVVIGVVAAAAAVIAVVVPVVLLGGDGGKKPSKPASVAVAPSGPVRWVGYRGIEVQVPADWPFAYGPGSPECIRPVTGEVPRGEGIPTRPYVEIEPKGRAVLAVLCQPGPAGRGPEPFGDLPVAFWQPHIQFSDAAMEGPPEGEWEYQGWTLTVRVVDDVRLSVLVDSDGYVDLAANVFDSLRRVEVDVNGCETTSAVQAKEFGRPESAIPPPSNVESVAICRYERTSTDQPGLVGSRRVEGPAARKLVRAVQEAPTTPGPDRQRDCSRDRFGDQAIALRAFDVDGASIGEAYVYYDTCFGNGVFDANGDHALTVDDCQPLFTAPPITLWSGSAQVFRVCHP